jgi:hypothetical protein
MNAPEPAGGRASLERRLGPLVAYVAQLPRWVPFAGVLVLLVGGLLAQGLVGAALLGVLGLALAVLLALSWPALHPGSRLVRLAVIAALLVRAGTFAVSRH